MSDCDVPHLEGSGSVTGSSRPEVPHELALPRKEGEGAHLNPLDRQLHAGRGGLLLHRLLSVLRCATAHEAGETACEEAQLKKEEKIRSQFDSVLCTVLGKKFFTTI